MFLVCCPLCYLVCSVFCALRLLFGVSLNVDRVMFAGCCLLLFVRRCCCLLFVLCAAC